MTQWRLSIPDETDRAVRALLERAGRRKDGLFRFVDEAVRVRVFDLTVDRIKDRNARRDRQAILDPIDEEVDAARTGRP